ncbi:MAG: PAS-domain containing protein, partial [Rhodothermales bacterium]|nr:PAS-domain containing protein [Rhodothermales bacterium]
RRELEELAHSKELLESSRMLAGRLHEEVSDLVASAKADSDLAARHSADVIRQGERLLLAIIAVSVAGAAMIMMFYVARRVIHPVQSMTGAMRGLAAGDTKVDIPAQDATDELGDMAKALKVFRDTAVEMQESNLREIRETRRRLIEAIESMSEGLSLYDADDRLVVCNTRYRQILYPGRHDLVTPGSSYETILREAAEAGLIADAEENAEGWIEERLARHRNPGAPHVQQRSDGRWVRVNERKTEDGGVVAVYTDITEDRAREEELREAKERAEQALEDLKQTQQSLIHAEKMASLGQLTAGVAHEIKNPLNFVKNFSETSSEVVEEIKESLESKLDALDEEARNDIEEQLATLQNFLAKIAEHGKRADDIVRNMLSHAREGSGELASTDFNSLVDETLNLTYHSMRAEHESFNLEIDKDFDASVGELEVNAQEITRVLLNLIGNACYAMQERKAASSSSDYRPVLTIRTKNLGDAVELRIKDNGTGVPDFIKDKIFDPFYTTKPTGEGTGLGLSLSYEAIVQQHNGEMTLESKEGEYTEFLVKLPRKAPARSKMAGPGR